MTATSPIPRARWYQKIAPLTVTSTEMRECGRILASYGDGKEWGEQPGEVAYLRANLTRPRYGLSRRVMLVLLFNGKAQRLADFIDAKRREKLGRSRAKDIPALILKETEDESVANVMESHVLAGQADRAEKLRLAEKSREQARDLMELADALNDDVHGAMS